MRTLIGHAGASPITTGAFCAAKGPRVAQVRDGAASTGLYPGAGLCDRLHSVAWSDYRDLRTAAAAPEYAGDPGSELAGDAAADRAADSLPATWAMDVSWPGDLVRKRRDPPPGGNRTVAVGGADGRPLRPCLGGLADYGRAGLAA